MDQENKIIAFRDEKPPIRHIWHEDELWLSVVDIIEVLTESVKPRDYWYRLKKREKTSSEVDLSTNCRHFKIKAPDGKMRQTECATRQGIFRIIQSVPSPKAEPFKQWLAKVGYERIQEIENPELAAKRAREYYKALGYDDEWIDKRLQSINIRGQLTDEWKNRGVKEGLEYSILTAEISQATFGLKPSEYKGLKNLKRENLRDHMSDLELIFTMLGETQTKIEATKKDAQGFVENKDAAQKGGEAAGDALDAFEKRTGDKVVSSDNFKAQIKAAKDKKKLEQKQKKLKDKKGKDTK